MSEREPSYKDLIDHMAKLSKDPNVNPSEKAQAMNMVTMVSISRALDRIGDELARMNDLMNYGEGRFGPG